jgi:hypothetical protein
MITIAARHAANAGRHAFEQRGYDLYETPGVAARALLQVETLPSAVWEPAAGFGSIVEVLRATGHRVVTVADFLAIATAPTGVSCIITHPPYRRAADFVRHALQLSPRVVMLLRPGFLESTGRSDILDGGQLAHVYPFRNRLPMMHWHGWQGSRASSSIPFGWYVWDRSHRGPAVLRRISWREGAPP